jgi:predicted transcriptional regulator
MYNDHMKPITINVSEPLYRLFKETARSSDRTASELIREAMEDYARNRILGAGTLENWQPISLGEVKKDWASGDFRNEMLDDRY